VDEVQRVGPEKGVQAERAPVVAQEVQARRRERVILGGAETLATPCREKVALEVAQGAVRVQEVAWAPVGRDPDRARADQAEGQGWVAAGVDKSVAIFLREAEHLLFTEERNTRSSVFE
jgi:hypothetical protein